ncbi:TonB-dependent receptor [Halopseudomonas laoshanensis]|uniref:TonB-dependent receptor n=1 Tax=Halopseudomonas laoshanensis TaxID=2268758 RepID=A0A7V7GUB3_9GAMM|nr:TonB-dependent receptor [Halopseudomonas laoshanensis]KAA0695078.1 TonB-dependent receptor [Halopseudomonas laoshanensis]
MKTFPAVLHPLASAVSIATLLVAVPALAQSTGTDPITLNPTEVTGEIGARQVESVEAVTLERFQATDLEDVFASQPEVSVGGGHSAAQKLYLRGIEDTQLNISIDGATQAGQTFHHTGRISIEPELLKRAEVQAGTGDATAGPGALGGSIRFVTKDPEDLLRAGESAGALVKGTYFSNAEGFKVNTSLFGRLTDSWSGMLVATHQDQNDYEDGSGDEVFGTGSRQDLGFAKLVGKLSADQTLRFSYDRRVDRGERTQRPQWVVSSFNPAYPLESQRDTYTLNYDWDPTGNPLLDVQATVFHTEMDLEQNVFDRWGLYYGNVESTGLDLRNTSLLGKHSLTYGVDHREDQVTAGPGGDQTAYEEDGSITGLYVQDSIRLNPKLLLGLGARYDLYRLTDATDQDFRDSGISPNVNLRYELNPNLSLLAGHSRALRGPRIRDAFKLDSATNDPDLKAEKARTTEVGFEYERGGLSLGGKVYQTEIEDIIVDFIGGPRLYENSGDLESQGVLLQAGYHWTRLSTGISYHHNDAELEGEPLNVYEHNGLGTSIGDTWMLNADYQFNQHLELGWQGRFVQSIDSLRTSVGRVDKPGYGVQDLYARWQPMADDSLTLSLTVKNLLDKDYLDHASNEDFQAIPDYEGIVGSAEPGREFRLGVAMRF